MVGRPCDITHIVPAPPFGGEVFPARSFCLLSGTENLCYHFGEMMLAGGPFRFGGIHSADRNGGACP